MCKKESHEGSSVKKEQDGSHQSETKKEEKEKADSFHLLRTHLKQAHVVPDPLFPDFLFKPEKKHQCSSPKLSPEASPQQSADPTLMSACLLYRNAVDDLALRLLHLRKMAAQQQIFELQQSVSHEKLQGHCINEAILKTDNSKLSSAPAATVSSLGPTFFLSSEVKKEKNCAQERFISAKNTKTVKPSSLITYCKSDENAETVPIDVKSEEKRQDVLVSVAYHQGEKGSCSAIAGETSVAAFQTIEEAPETLGNSMRYTSTTKLVPSLVASSELICNVWVYGPYSRWLAPQRAILQCLIEALQQRRNAVLESPTGTGKTAALLCGALAWQMSVKRQSALQLTASSSQRSTPVIFFCTRTHSQITQLVKELRRTPYRPATVCLAAPKHLCPFASQESTSLFPSGLNPNQLRSVCRDAVSLVEKRRLRRFRRVARLVERFGFSAGLSALQDDYASTSKNLFLKCGSSNGSAAETLCQGCPFYSALDHPSFGRRIFQTLVPAQAIITNNSSSDLPCSHETIAFDPHNSNNETEDKAIWNIHQLKQITLATDANVYSQWERSEIKNAAMDPDSADASRLSVHCDEVPIPGCPYYTAHALARTADLIILPYQFLLSPAYLSRSRLPLAGSVLIIDEAHNVEQTCRDEGSASFLRCHLIAFLDILSTLVDQISGFPISVIMRQLGYSDLSQSATPLLFSSRQQIPTIQTDLLLLLTTTLALPPRVHDLIVLACSVWVSLTLLLHDAEVFLKLHCPKMLINNYSPSQTESFVKVASWGIGASTPILSGCEGFFKAFNLTDHDINCLTQYTAMLHDAALRFVKESEDSLAVNDTTFLSQKPYNLEYAAVRRFVSALSSQPATQFLFVMEILALCVQNKRCYVVSFCHRKTNVVDWEIHMRLMIPAPVMELLSHKCRSIILASGTLTPVNSLITELGPTFASRVLRVVQAPHVIAQKQLLGLVVSDIVGNTLLNKPCRLEARCFAKTLEDSDFLTILGHSIVRLLAEIPGGVMIFLPSYSILKRVVRVWRISPITSGTTSRPLFSVWEQLCAVKKHIFVEPRDQHVFVELLAQFRHSVEQKGTAVVLSVYRAKISEGISMSDDYVRGVICVGIPYPSLANSAVVEKKMFNNTLAQHREMLHMIISSSRDTAEQLEPDNSQQEPLEEPKPNNKEPTDTTTLHTKQLDPPLWLSGNRWYSLQAFRALNQAMGRVIRHKHDFGVIILLDSRHVLPGFLPPVVCKNDFCLWIRPYLSCASLSSAADKLRSFFASTSFYRSPLLATKLEGPTLKSTTHNLSSAVVSGSFPSLANTQCRPPLLPPIKDEPSAATKRLAKEHPRLAPSSTRTRISSLMRVTSSSNTTVTPMLLEKTPLSTQSFCSKTHHTVLNSETQRPLRMSSLAYFPHNSSAIHPPSKHRSILAKPLHSSSKLVGKHQDFLAGLSFKAELTDLCSDNGQRCGKTSARRKLLLENVSTNDSDHTAQACEHRTPSKNVSMMPLTDTKLSTFLSQQLPAPQLLQTTHKLSLPVKSQPAESIAAAEAPGSTASTVQSKEVFKSRSYYSNASNSSNRQHTNRTLHAIPLRSPKPHFPICITKNQLIDSYPPEKHGVSQTSPSGTRDGSNSSLNGCANRSDDSFFPEETSYKRRRFSLSKAGVLPSAGAHTSTQCGSPSIVTPQCYSPGTIFLRRSQTREPDGSVVSAFMPEQNVTSGPPTLLDTIPHARARNRRESLLTPSRLTRHFTLDQTVKDDIENVKSP